jgi:F-type H+-transporting ATPase subunit alpha
MADLTIDPKDISAVLRKYVDEFSPTVEREQVGRVLYSGDGIARISGLPGCMANERLEFPNGIAGVALNLEPDEIGAVVLGDASAIEEGDPVKLTGQILSVPVGDALLGRVVNVLGEPIDGGGPLDASKITGSRPLEVQAASVVQRQPVKEPLYFGIKAVDSMTAVGRGQRELIIGDRKTGKTAVAVDAIINQKQFWGTDKQVKCIYVAIGRRIRPLRRSSRHSRTPGRSSTPVSWSQERPIRRRSSTWLRMRDLRSARTGCTTASTR